MGRPHAEGSCALRVVIVIENMSYTFDTRVRNIARTLERNGNHVWVICPRYPGDPLKRVEGGVTIYFYPLPPLPGGLVGHVLEYLYSFASISVATLIAFFRVRFDVIHVCNPPDIFFPLAGALSRVAAHALRAAGSRALHTHGGQSRTCHERDRARTHLSARWYPA
jgi:hypothetical protein